MSTELIGPVMACGHFTAVADCAYLRLTMGRSKRFKGIPCMWMVENGFTRRAGTSVRADGVTVYDQPLGER